MGGNHEDWIEIYNEGASSVSLDGWYLTDNAGDLTKWRFPNTNIAPAQFIVVFASDKTAARPGAVAYEFQAQRHRRIPHTVQPDGTTIATQFAPTYPRRLPTSVMVSRRCRPRRCLRKVRR